MKVFNEVFGVSSQKRCEMIDITGRVAELVRQAEITAGEATVYCPHTTAAITINENADPSVTHDVLLTLEELIPQRRRGYRHSEGNSDAHTKSSLVGTSTQILIRDGQVVLGTWQGIYFCEFDGPRSRKVIVQIRGQ
ncbi:MAG TPA: YjbQ family protein [Planctomycetes bacterium]|nr:YjbQ family protein [Planctomycetota bacterium]HIJ70218.1 YjbQ family protein [Planctomycetota bacterium]